MSEKSDKDAPDDENPVRSPEAGTRTKILHARSGQTSESHTQSESIATFSRSTSRTFTEGKTTANEFIESLKTIEGLERAKILAMEHLHSLHQTRLTINRSVSRERELLDYIESEIARLKDEREVETVKEEEVSE